MQTQTRRIALQNFLRGIQICHMKADILVNQGSLLEILARCTCWTWEVCAVCGQCGGFSQCNDWKTNKYSGGGDFPTVVDKYSK